MIRVLVVDDSAFARKVIREVLSADAEIEVVGIARDGLEALEKIASLKPDVVTLDLVMPDLDGLGVLEALKMQGSSARVVIVSVSGSETELAIEALHRGAVELVNKPTPLPTDRLYELKEELVEKVKAAFAAKPSAIPDIEAPSVNQIRTELNRATIANLVVIGTSTGGPQAITELFKRLPVNLPVPIVIALHIPAGYTKAIATRITQLGRVPLDEAFNGMVLRPGRAVIAPGGRHLQILREHNQFVARVTDEPRELMYHPSIDLLFESASIAGGSGVIGVVMTGMGDDGTRGCRLITQAGGRVLAESKASCVVYGMPRSVIESGVPFEEAVLGELPNLIVRLIAAN